MAVETMREAGQRLSMNLEGMGVAFFIAYLAWTFLPGLSWIPLVLSLFTFGLSMILKRINRQPAIQTNS